MKANLGSHGRNYLVILVLCALVFALAIVVRPHDCKPTYGPAPYYYCTDLPLWVALADKPIENLGTSILANRPVFAYLGWLFAQPAKLFFGSAAVSSPTRAGGVASAHLATLAGLFAANGFCYALTGVFLYRFTHLLTQNKRAALLAAVLWCTSSYAFAWSYHPTDQMGGLVLIFAFPLFLFSLSRASGLASHLLFCLGFGFLLLMKAYYVLPFIYLFWGLANKFRLPTLLLGFALFFAPTLLWRQIYHAITGQQLVDFQLGARGVAGFIRDTCLSLAGIRTTFQILVVSCVKLPQVVFNSSGLIVGVAAMGFFLNPAYVKRYPRFALFAGMYLPFFVVFLTLAGFFTPRHGSDFSPLLCPAAAIVLHEVFSKVKSRVVLCLSLAMFILLTALSYTQTWLCAAAFF